MLHSIFCTYIFRVLSNTKMMLNNVSTEICLFSIRYWHVIWPCLQICKISATCATLITFSDYINCCLVYFQTFCRKEFFIALVTLIMFYASMNFLTFLRTCSCCRVFFSHLKSVSFEWNMQMCFFKLHYVVNNLLQKSQILLLLIFISPII